MLVAGAVAELESYGLRGEAGMLRGIAHRDWTAAEFVAKQIIHLDDEWNRGVAAVYRDYLLRTTTNRIDDSTQARNQAVTHTETERTTARGAALHVSATVFISYAHEEQFVARPLAELLSKAGLRVWFAPFTLKVGDSLFDKINEGLRDCDYGVVILSRMFLTKNWARAELKALLHLQMRRESQVVLPVWHGITKDDVLDSVPLMSDFLALNTEDGIVEVAAAIIQAVEEAQELRIGGAESKERSRDVL